MADPTPVQPPAIPAFIVEVRRYANHLGFQIEQRTLVSGTIPESYPEFSGISMFSMKAPNGQPIANGPIQFSIPVSTLAEAFEQFKHFRAIEVVAQEKKIIEKLHEQVGVNSLLGADGVPMRRGG